MIACTIHLCYLPWRDFVNNYHTKTRLKLEKEGYYSSHHNLCESNIYRICT